LPGHETLLLLLLFAEIACFSIVGIRFGPADNVANIVRPSVEMGLLALVMTPIILTLKIGCAREHRIRGMPPRRKPKLPPTPIGKR
jgi:hypothetical protein